MNEIQLIQSPIIKHNIIEMGAEIRQRIEALEIENQVATEDTVTFLKKTRAELNKEAVMLEDSRKQIKAAILQPYDEFETLYVSEILNQYKAAETLLKNKVTAFEFDVKKQKRDNLIEYFNELIQLEKLDWLTFDQLKIEVLLSTTEKKYKEQIYEAVTKIISEIELIKSDEFFAEMMVEYKASLNIATSITNVRQRKEKERAEKERAKMIETQNRQLVLRSMTMVYFDLSKTFNYINDETIYISLKDIEQLPKDDFNAKVFDIQSKIQSQKVANVAKKPEIVEAKQPEIQVINNEIFEASFTVSGTFAELQNLKQFLVSNNYSYKNN